MHVLSSVGFCFQVDKTDHAATLSPFALCPHHYLNKLCQRGLYLCGTTLLHQYTKRLAQAKLERKFVAACDELYFKPDGYAAATGFSDKNLVYFSASFRSA